METCEDCKILIVGEAPGALEDEHGRPFIGKSGIYLRRSLLSPVMQSLKEEPFFEGWSEEGVAYIYPTDHGDIYVPQWKHVAFTNACRCRPKDNETPEGLHYRKCRAHLIRDIFEADPEIVFAFGRIAAAAVLGAQIAIANERGTVRHITLRHPDTKEERTYPVSVTYHPAYLLRGNKAREEEKVIADIINGLGYLVSGGEEELSSVDYRVAKSVDDLREFVRYIKDSKLLSVDIETTGLNPYEKTKRIVHEDRVLSPGAQVLGVSFCVRERTGWYIPLNGVDKEQYRKVVKAVLESDIPKIGHNIKFDYRYLKVVEDIEIKNIVGDTLLISHYLDSRQRQRGLKILALEYTDMPHYEDMLQKQAKGKQAEAKKARSAAKKKLKKLLTALPDTASEEMKDAWHVNIVDIETVLDYIGLYSGFNPNDLNVRELVKLFESLLEDHQREYFLLQPLIIDFLTEHREDIVQCLNSLLYAYAMIDVSNAFWECDLETLGIYACGDVDVALRVYNQLYPKIKQHKAFNSYQKISVPLISLLADIEINGMALDKEYVTQLEKDIDEEYKTVWDYFCSNPYVKKYHEQNDHLFNPRSFKQREELFFNTMSIPVLRKTDAEAPSLNKDALFDYDEYYTPIVVGVIKKLAIVLGDCFSYFTCKEKFGKYIVIWDNGEVELDDEGFSSWLTQGLLKPLDVIAGETETGSGVTISYTDILQDILFLLPSVKEVLTKEDIYNILEAHAIAMYTIMSKYAWVKSNVLNKTDTWADENGLVHTWFKLTGTETYRLSSGDKKINAPNMQNISRLSRFKNVFRARSGRLLLAADESQIELRVGAVIANATNMLRLFSEGGADIHTATAAKVYEKLPEEVTKEERTAAKGTNFMLFYGGEANGLALRLGWSVERAEEFMERYFEAFPGIRYYREEMANRAKMAGVVEGIFGHHRYTEVSTEGINFPVQVSAAFITYSAMLDLNTKIKEQGLDALIVAQVHDDIKVDVAEKDLLQTAYWMKYCMEHPSIYQGEITRVPLVADLEVGRTLGGLQDFEDYVTLHGLEDDWRKLWNESK